jgi:hypothetical protein
MNHLKIVRWNIRSDKKLSLCIDHLNAELNPICHLLALLGAHHIIHVSRIRVKYAFKI